MQFQEGDATYNDLREVVFHEFILCEGAFDEFARFAGLNIMGASDSATKLRSYNAYSQFLVHLYEFYVGCFKLDRGDTRSICFTEMDGLLVFEAEKSMKRRRHAIIHGYAPEWENDASYYDVAVPADFGRRFCEVRNRTAHADIKRNSESELGLMGFYRDYHRFAHLLFADARWLWSGRNHKSQTISHVESFDFNDGWNG